MKIATKLHEIDLQAASEVADSENENLYREIIDPTPGLILDDEIDIDNQFSFRTDSDTSDTLPNALKSKLENTLQYARDKVNSILFTPKPVEKIPNNPLYNETEFETEEFYIDESFKNLFYHSQESIYFRKLSTDNRKDFEVNVSENDIIVFKSPSLSLVSVEKKEIKRILDKIIEDLNLKITETLMTGSNKLKTEQKIFTLENLKKKLKTNKNNKIIFNQIVEEQLSHGWLNQLVEEQLKQNEKYYKLDNELITRVNNLFNNLQKNLKSIFICVSKVFINLYNQLEDKNFRSKKEFLPIVTPFSDIKSNVNHSSLFSIGKPFELFHADIVDTRFLAKSAVDPKYCLLLVDLFTSKIYIYAMKNRSLLAKKLKLFYDDIKSKSDFKT